LDAFSDAIARFPERADIRAARAWVRLQLGDARSARFDAKWALDIDPTNAYAKQTWLKALDKAGEDATLRHALDEAISAEPEADLLVSRAVLLATSNDAKIRDPKAALTDAIRADELTFGLSRSALRAKAAAQAALGDFPSAVGNSYRAMFREMPNRDGGTDVIRIVTYLARKPLARDVWDKDPPERNRRSLQAGVGAASTIGAYFEVDCTRAFWVRVALPRALPIPIAIVRWNAQGMKEFCDELRTLIARGEPARSKSQKGPSPEH
jgi:tetratricopeptide (TPR) repeat protein